MNKYIFFFTLLCLQAHSSTDPVRHVGWDPAIYETLSNKHEHLRALYVTVHDLLDKTKFEAAAADNVITRSANWQDLFRACKTTFVYDSMHAK